VIQEQTKEAGPTPTPRPESRAGLAYGVAAYGLWGLMPIYFHAIDRVPPLEVLAHRIVWSAVLLAGVIAWRRRWAELSRCLRQPRTRWPLTAGTLLLAVNWFLFLYGVSTAQLVQTSLGYFINPLLNVLLGLLVFHERLRGVQWLALALAAVGLVYQVAALGQWPWIAFTLAGSFAGYGLIRKLVPVDTLLGLTAETLILLPAALAVLAWWAWQGPFALGSEGWALDLLLMASGVATVLPLFCFGQAVRLVRLSTLGFLQYLGPSLQLLLAVTVYGEPFSPAQQVSFGLIWLALLLVSVQGLFARRAITVPAQPADAASSPGSARHRGQAASS